LHHFPRDYGIVEWLLSSESDLSSWRRQLVSEILDIQPSTLGTGFPTSRLLARLALNFRFARDPGASRQLRSSSPNHVIQAGFLVTDAAGLSIRSLQLRVLHFGLLQDGDVGVCLTAWIPARAQRQNRSGRAEQRGCCRPATG